MTEPWIRTKRLVIDFVKATDEPALREIIGWLNNPTTMRYSEQRHCGHTLMQQKAYIQAMNVEDMYLAILHEDLMIGTIMVTIDRYNMIADVGILLGDSAKWGCGFGFEAWKAVCDRLLEQYRKIEAGCMDCNLAMMGICSRYGMYEEGRRDDHFICLGTVTDMVLWGKIK